MSREPTKAFVAAWEYMDGSGGWHDFDDYEAAYAYIKPFFGEPLRLWINDDMIQQGFIAGDER